MPVIPPHEWLRPRLVALLVQAEAAGIARDISVAVITDLITGPLSTGGQASDENWNLDIGEPAYLTNVTAPEPMDPSNEKLRA